jgi:hypothetical protein
MLPKTCVVAQSGCVDVHRYTYLSITPLHWPLGTASTLRIAFMLQFTRFGTKKKLTPGRPRE